MPVVGGGKVLLVPKSMVYWKASLTAKEYYDHFVVNYLRDMELQAPGSALVHIVQKTGKRRVFKKDIKERNPLSKEMLRVFTAEHPEVLDIYKRRKAEIRPLRDSEIDEDFNEAAFARALVDRMGQVPPGNEDASSYHKLMIGMLEFVFYPNLQYPRKEREIHDGRKRIDIAYTNCASDGVFKTFPRTARRSAIEILVECKNYSREIGNPELDQLTGRFANHRGWLGILTCRSVDDMETLMQRCRDTARDGRGFVVVLTDEDLKDLLVKIARGDRAHVNRFLDRRFRALLE